MGDEIGDRCSLLFTAFRLPSPPSLPQASLGRRTMDDDEAMEAYRQKRMAEMQGDEIQKKQQQMQQQRANEEMKRTMLTQILTPEARERLSRIRLVKESKANAVEMMLIQAAQQGKLGGKVSDAYLVKMLEQLNKQQGNSRGPKVTIQRRRPTFDSDDDDY